jgi:P4 family phage/plasmid primase-like protien
MSTLSPLGRAALMMAGSGMAVFPLKPGTKVPATTHGQDDATTDEAQIIAWWTRMPTANIGTNCALSGFYVIDVDCGGDKVGAASWAALERAHGHVDTYTVRTQSGGLHYYYRMPAEPLANTAGKLGKHIDTRGNGYVVSPGSVVQGNTYTVVDDSPVADLPRWVIDAVRKPTRPVTPPKTATSLYLTAAPASDVQDRVRQLSTELADTAEGSRNDTAARIAFMVGGYVGAGQIDITTATGILLDAIAGWPDDDTEMRMHQNTIVRQVEEGAKHPRTWEAARFPESPGTALRPVPGYSPLTDDMAAEFTDPTDDVDDVKPETKRDLSDWTTDGGQGRWLAGRLPGAAWAPGLGWLLWDGARWRQVEVEAVSATVRRIYAAEFAKWAKKYAASGEEKDEAMAKTFRKYQQSGAISGVLTGLRDAVYRDAVEFDAHPHLLNTPAGVVDLRTGKVGPHDPNLLITKVTAGRFIPGYRHPDWEAAQAALPPESAEWLQVRMGAAIAGTQLADDAVFLHGGGSNGKSLFSNDGVVRALGDYAMLTSSDLIASRKADATAATPDKADLRGARFVLIEELPEEFAMSTKAVKELAGTGAIRARHLYKNAITFDATHSLFVNTNHQPNVTDTDWGTWRRLTMVTFPYTFTSRRVEENDRVGDRDLVNRVRANVDGQHDAIVTWLVEGAQAALADPSCFTIGKHDSDDGRAVPVKESTREWRKSTDRLMGYADECLILERDACIAKVDLVWHFNRWLAEQGASKWSARLLADRMKGHPSLRGVTVARAGESDHPTRPLAPGSDWNSTIPTLSNRPEVFRGIRFSAREDQPGYGLGIPA